MTIRNRNALAISNVAIVVILIFVIGLSFLGLYLAGLLRLLSQVSSSVRLIGVCRATTYLLPGTLELYASNVTVTTNDTTSFYECYSTSTPPTMTLGNTTYTLTTTTDSSTSYIVTNTTVFGTPPPTSLPFAVSICTYSP